jgi:hypothetical protein
LDEVGAKEVFAALILESQPESFLEYSPKPGQRFCLDAFAAAVGITCV